MVAKHGWRSAAVSILLLVGTAAPALAQYQITSLEELRRELAGGDLVTVVQRNGNSVKGRIVGIGIGGWASSQMIAARR